MDTSDLIRAAVRGRRHAWAVLLERHGPAVYGLCRRLTADPDDAYQEVWAKVHTRLARFDPDARGSFRGWLITLTHRHLVDRYRRAQARVALVGADPDAFASPADGFVAASLAERRRLVEAALPHIPVVDRRALVLHHLCDQDLAEIAASEGVPVGTIKSRLHRARKRLTALLEGP